MTMIEELPVSTPKPVKYLWVQQDGFRHTRPSRNTFQHLGIRTQDLRRRRRKEAIVTLQTNEAVLIAREGWQSPSSTAVSTTAIIPEENRTADYGINGHLPSVRQCHQAAPDLLVRPWSGADPFDVTPLSDVPHAASMLQYYLFWWKNKWPGWFEWYSLAGSGAAQTQILTNAFSGKAHMLALLTYAAFLEGSDSLFPAPRRRPLQLLQETLEALRAAVGDSSTASEDLLFPISFLAMIAQERNDQAAANAHLEAVCKVAPSCHQLGKLAPNYVTGTFMLVELRQKLPVLGRPVIPGSLSNEAPAPASWIPSHQDKLSIAHGGDLEWLCRLDPALKKASRGIIECIDTLAHVWKSSNAIVERIWARRRSALIILELLQSQPRTPLIETSAEFAWWREQGRIALILYTLILMNVTIDSQDSERLQRLRPFQDEALAKYEVEGRLPIWSALDRWGGTIREALGSWPPPSVDTVLLRLTCVVDELAAHSEVRLGRLFTALVDAYQKHQVVWHGTSRDETHLQEDFDT